MPTHQNQAKVTHPLTNPLSPLSDPLNGTPKRPASKANSLAPTFLYDPPSRRRFNNTRNHLSPAPHGSDLKSRNP